MKPKAIKKKRWVRARSLSPVLHSGDRQERSAKSATDEFFAEAFRLSPHPIGITELETGRCLEINDACLEIFGFRRDEVIGKTTLMLGIWPDPVDRARLVDRLRAEGAVRNHEVSMRMKNGERRQFLVSTNVITLKGKACILTIGSDITERKQAEEALRRFSETLEQRVEERTTALRTVRARQQLLLTSTPVVLYACRVNGDYGATFVSENVVEQLGYSPQDFTDHAAFWINHVHPDDRASVRAGLARTFEHGRHIHEYRFLHGDRSYRWLRDEVRLLHDEDGVPLELIGFLVDISSQKSASEALHESEERSDQVIRLANFGIFDHDHRTGKVYWSPVMRDMYGVGHDEPASVERYLNLIHPDDRESVVTAMKPTNHSTGDDLNPMEHRVVRTDGGIRWLSLRLWTLFDNEGSERRPARTLGAMIDITKRKQAEEALKISERRFASFMDNLHGFAWIKDEQGRYLYVNRLFQESLVAGLDWKEKTARELWSKEIAEQYEINDKKVWETRMPLHTVAPFIQNGEVRHALVSKFPIVDHEGSPTLLGGVAVDITERKQAEELLRQQTDLLNQSHDAIFVWKIGGGIVYWNRGAEELYGWRSDEVIGRSSHTLLNMSPSTMTKEMEACLAREGRWYGEVTHIAKDGRELIVESRHVRVMYGGQEYALESNRDITERKLAEEALHRQQVQLEELTSKLLTAQEHERRRIAQDLHDDVSQRLAALVLEVASFETHPSGVPTELAQGLGALRQGLEQVSDDLHGLAYRLHPSLLEHAGLRPAVEDHVQQVSRRTGLPIRLKIAGVSGAVPLDHATCLFRVMQESVQNVVKHAQATLVTVRLQGSSKGLGLSVTDNGRGFNVKDLHAQDQGLGLSSMEERLRQLQGFFRIQSKPSQGTKVCAWVPFEGGGL